MNQFDHLFDKGISVVKETKESIIGNIGKVVTLLTLLAVSIVIFTEVSFVKMNAEAFTCELIALLIGAVVSYFAMESQGEHLGLECEEGAESLRALTESIARIHGEDMESLAEFCTRYAEEDARGRRARYLLSHGLTESDLLAYQKGEACKKKTARILHTAARMRPIALTPATLLTTGTREVGEELFDPQSRRGGYLFFRLLPSVLCMTLTVSIAISAKGELTFAVIAQGVLKLLTLIGICARGYLQGYMYAKERLIPWIRTRTRLIGAYLSENKE